MLKAESTIIGAGEMAQGTGLTAEAVRTEFRYQHYTKAGLVRTHP